MMTVKDKIALGIGNAVIKFIGRYSRNKCIRSLGIEEVFGDTEAMIDDAVTEFVQGLRAYVDFEADVAGDSMAHTSPCLVCLNKQDVDDDSGDWICRCGHDVDVVAVYERCNIGCKDFDKDAHLYASLLSVDKDVADRWNSLDFNGLTKDFCSRLLKHVASAKEPPKK